MFLWISVSAFTLAALTGVTMATFHWRKKLPPAALSLAKILFVLTGVAMLILGIFDETPGVPARVALVCFLAAGLGGIALGTWHYRQIPAPKIVIVLHASIAVMGYVALWVELLGLVPTAIGNPA